MKRFLTYKSLFFILFAVSVVASCSREITERHMAFPGLDPLKADSSAGTWKMILLSGPEAIAINPPLATNSNEYKTELNEIRSWQYKMTDKNRDLVKYWSAGAVLRWNEILRELVAKYNLAPYQNADGTYPVPNSNNPLAYPYFPFANPPYAARAYAYISAAQYDALVSCWHYKYKFRRNAPKKTDGSIELLIPESKVPSYPSEDAVVAGAAAEMLSLLFPGEQAYIAQKLEEHRNARMMAGANVRSDLDAGELLGREVAKKFITRARGDRAGKAIGTTADWKKMESDAIGRGQTPWLSQESPARPPMLPLFGLTKGFLLDSMEVVNGRPAAPPALNSAEFNTAIAEVKNYSENPTRERMRIVHFWADGAGTYTPPGHWNAIACEDFVGLRFSEVRWARNLALLNMAMFDAAICCWDTKYAYYYPRPSQVDPKIKTLTGLPNFPSYTSGHSTFSAAAATVLGYINPGRAQAYTDMMNEASNSRIYGGIHYRFDCKAGLQSGTMIGNKAIARGQSDGAGQ